jgi:predicted permease
VSLLCAAVFGILPAIEKPRAAALAGRSAKSGAHARLRRILVAAQIAICVVLLSSASLLIRSFWNLEQQSLGMQTRGVITVRVPLTGQRYPSQQTYMDFHLRAEAALRRLPGVTAVGISDSVPPDADFWHDERRYADIFVAGKPFNPAGAGGSVMVRTVTPGYFKVLQIPIVQGRGFTEEERSSNENLLIFSRTLASRLFPGENPIGRHIQFGRYLPYFVLEKPVFTVIGVAANVKNGGLAGQDNPEYYALRTNRPDLWNVHAVIVMESTLPASVVAPWIRSQIGQIDPVVPVEVNTLAQTVSKLADRPRFETALIGFFAFCGLLMAVIGLYGVIAYVAAQRTQEIGVRMALGATRMDILRLIAGEGLRLIVSGGAVGLGAALAAAQLLKSMLFGVGPRDPAAFMAVALLLGLVALAATLIPARAAMRVEPVVALRYE